MNEIPDVSHPVLCELGMCDCPHNQEKRRSTRAQAVQWADGDTDLADDAIHDAFESLRRTLAATGWREVENPRGYGMRAVRNRVMDGYRSRRRQSAKECELEPTLVADHPEAERPPPGPVDITACRRELTRLFYHQGTLRCARHPRGCPHPEVVFSMAFGTLTVAMELAAENPEEFGGAAGRRRVACSTIKNKKPKKKTTKSK